MNPRVSLKYSLNNCSLLNMLVSIIKYHCLSHSKCGVCCINVFFYSLDIFCFVELSLHTIFEWNGGTFFLTTWKLLKLNGDVDWMRETLSFFCISKLSGPELKEFAQKMCANADKWWDSKERHTTQWKCKNYSNHKQNKNALTIILMNFFIK